MTNEPSNHIDLAVSWTDEATITLESTSPFNAGASERSHDRFGREARAGDGGALGGPGWSGEDVVAVRLS